jgi:predicted DNA-binding transcriptional regulator AlpA
MNVVLSPIDPEILINSISDRITANLLKAEKSKASKHYETEDNDELLTVEDTAKFLHLSIPSIYGLIHKGQLPVMKRSKRCYFLKKELIEYLKQGRKKTIVERDAEIKNERDGYLLTKKKKG